MAYCDFVAGVFAGKKHYLKNNLNYIFIQINFIYLGACNMVVSHPLDTVKTNMQSGNMPFFRAAMAVVKDEGVLYYTLYITFK